MLIYVRACDQPVWVPTKTKQRSEFAKLCELLESVSTVSWRKDASGG